MLVINKRGTTRNIEDSQYNEYRAKGYEKVESKKIEPKEDKKEDRK